MKTLHLPTKEISPLAGKALLLLSQARCEDNPEAREFLRGLAAAYCQRARRANFEARQRQHALAWAEAFADDHGTKRVHYVDVMRGIPQREMPEARRASRRVNMWA